MAQDWVAPGERNWAQEACWGTWAIPNTELPLLADELAGQRAIELGCGTGYVSAWMRRRGALVYAIDNSEDRLATARRLCDVHGLDGIEWVHGNAEAMPQPDGSLPSRSGGHAQNRAPGSLEGPRRRYELRSPLVATRSGPNQFRHRPNMLAGPDANKPQFWGQRVSPECCGTHTASSAPEAVRQASACRRRSVCPPKRGIGGTSIEVSAYGGGEDRGIAVDHDPVHEVSAALAGESASLKPPRSVVAVH